ncbi:MAG: 1-acyl-sn-glycerol-3-phosphate acyltransferase [Proteobacteria bacterium]|nr:1-acyl-sn-glycerol-3-phosphate acyltransferase [Pseudomonadota bacterium]
MKKLFHNIFSLINASVRFVLFWLWSILNAMFATVFTHGGEFGAKHMRVFMRVAMRLVGLRIAVHGELPASRPIMIVSNHISIFEFASYPVAFGGSFFSKGEMKSWPFVGYMTQKFSAIFVDRRPSHVVAAIENVRKEMSRATWPMVLFPEGTTTNGAYVKDFKSSLFNFLEMPNGGLNANVTIQPVAMFYRHLDGTAISDVEMANEYAYFANDKMTYGPLCNRERSWVGQLFHIFMLGGFIVEMYLLPPPPLAEIHTRKELATILHKQISETYMKLKGKNYVKNSNHTNPR